MGLDARVLAGDVIAGKYVVERTLGMGGMATVFAAAHRQLGERVAIKVLHAHVVRRAGAIERFLNEARVAMRLRGEHVARVHDIGTIDDGTPFMVMELLEGADLGSVLQSRGPLPIDEACDYVLQACEAMAEAHGAGVVHRDLKPANLFLTARVDGSPCVKVLDFGVSKVRADDRLAETQDDPLGPTAPSSERRGAREPLGAATTMAGDAPAHATRTNAMLGSPRYMAPEQIRAARDVDARADVWALGVILYELVSGVPPFAGATLDDLCARILDGPAPPLGRGGLDAVMAIALAKDRAHRFRDVHALAEAIAPHASPEGRASLERIARIRSGRHALRIESSASGVAFVSERTPESRARSRPGTSRARRAAAVASIAIAASLATGLTVARFAAKTAAPAREAPALAAPSFEPPASTSPLPASTAPPAAPHETPKVHSASIKPRRAPAPAPASPPPPAPASASAFASASAPASASTSPPPDPLGLEKGFLFDDRR